MEKPTVFVSYCHRDREWKDKLHPHLRGFEKQGHFAVWDDTCIGVGEGWEEKIAEAIEGAQVACLLISADFLASDFVQDTEMPRLLSRRDKRELGIVPVLVEPCAWDAHERLSGLQVRPSDNKALSTGSPSWLQEQLTEIAREIKQMVDAQWLKRVHRAMRRHKVFGLTIVALLALGAGILCLDVVSRESYRLLVEATGLHPRQVTTFLWALLMLLVVLYHANLSWIGGLLKRIASVNRAGKAAWSARDVPVNPVQLYIVPSAAILVAVLKLGVEASRPSGPLPWSHVVFGLAIVVQSLFCYRFLRRVS